MYGFFVTPKNLFRYYNEMIVIYKGQENDVVLTLKESTTLTAPYYLFEFIRDLTNPSPIYFTTADVSAYPNRFNHFVIEEASAGTGTVSLAAGQYTYRVYQTATSTTNPANIVGDVLEEGIMNVIDDDIDGTVYE